MYFVLILIVLFVYKIYYENKITECLKNNDPMPKIPNPNTLFKVFIAIVVIFIVVIIAALIFFTIPSSHTEELYSEIRLEVDGNNTEHVSEEYLGFSIVIKSEYQDEIYKPIEKNGVEFIVLDITVWNYSNETKNLLDYLVIDEGNSIINLEYTSQILLKPIGPGESAGGNIYFKYLGDRKYPIGMYSSTNEKDNAIYHINVKK
ncbi:hypothetical protein RJG79_01350 [Mycoplasmatota bacterium WC44]